MSTQPTRPHPLGVRPRDGGVDVAVFAGHADAVEFCVLGAGARDGAAWKERRVELTGRTHGVWHGFVPDVPLGARYGFRVHGRWDPRHGLRHNPHKFLLDPYARAVVPPAMLAPELFGHTVDEQFEGNHRVMDERDSAPFAAHGVVTNAPKHRHSTKPHVPWRDTVVYEAHVRGLTKRLPDVPEELRGTYAGLAHEATLEHLKGLGVTTVELLPVHVSLAEPHLARRGLPNYWGYSTLNFFAPNPNYAAATDPQGVLDEFKAMVQALHAAGLEVLLDVVYNHTCEVGVTGPTLSWRGLDAPGYYRLDSGGHDIDFTGCGNSLDATSDRVVQLVLDSLRYWVTEMDVDGFRFDLAPTLARGHNEFYRQHPLLVAMRVDPVLAGVKLVVEPWDVGPDGWVTGGFGAPFAEWNDRFRDDVREFWLPGAARALAGETPGGLRDLGTRLAGSADMFEPGRGPLAGVNFVTAHDGFTLADCVAFNHKHNEANGEANRDGSDHNRSWNHGVEGWSALDVEVGPEVAAQRRRSIRNLLATLLFAAGVPMITGGDEFGRSQGGNNNPYCLDDETSWLDWDLDDWQRDLLATTRQLVALRKRFGGVRATEFFTGLEGRNGMKDLTWFRADGPEMQWQDWEDSHLRTLLVRFAASDLDESTEALLLVVNGAAEEQEIRLPRDGRYARVWSSGWERPRDPEAPRPPSSTTTVDPLTVDLYVTG
ncbi:glycogen debranching protein GlgX [Spongisporangium articulatum]|uniref:Glycogen debranching protein GlgX n=1 Tax=Spongisporangium articulatum TaxID=3362603 RepID=A0ABW8API0_9ACTN